MNRFKKKLTTSVGLIMLSLTASMFTVSGTDAAKAVNVTKNNQTIKLNEGSKTTVKLAGKALKKLKNSKKKITVKLTGKKIVNITRSKAQKKNYSFTVKAIKKGSTSISINYKKSSIKLKVKVSGKVNDTSSNTTVNIPTATPLTSAPQGNNNNTPTVMPNVTPTPVPSPTEVPLRTEITEPESKAETVDGKTKLTDLTTYSVNSSKVFNLWTDGEGKLYYNVTSDGTSIIEISSLGLELSDTNLSEGLTYDKGSSVVYELYEEYDSITLASSRITNHCHERVITFKNDEGASFTLIIRVYDDGVAFRYTNVKSGTGNELTCTNETSNVVLPEGTYSFAGWGGINTYEYDFSEMKYNSFVQRSGKYDTPFLTNLGNYWMLISEAQIYNNHAEFCKSVLKTSGGKNSLEWDFGDGRDESTPLEEQAKKQNTNLDLVNVAQKTITEVNTVNGFSTPWRAMVISDDLNTFCTSPLISNLNPAPKDSDFADVYEDISWIKPGKVLWSWWSDGNNQDKYNTHKKYIDFASDYGFDYICLDVGWRSFEDRLSELCDYAAEKDVKVFCWVNYWELTTEEDIEALFSKWADAGAVGLKTDYFEGEDQKVLDVMEDIAVIAARHHMMVLYHGCVAPGGEYRTYPNVMTTEAVQGEENRKWSESPSSRNCLMYPFTRNILGSMDYTPACKTIQNMIGETESFALAKTIVYESSLIHFAAAAAEYEDFLGLPFMQNICTTWDESFIPAGEAYPGKYITYVRRNDKKWFIGSMTLEAKNTDIKLDFLEDGKTYKADIYTSDDDGMLSYEEREVTKADTLSFDFKKQDGAAVYIRED